MENKHITQKISNSPLFSEVERTIQIAGLAINFDAKTLDLYYRIIYSKDSQDVSHLFTSQVPQWHIDNTQSILVRDETFQPILNPDYKEELDDDNNINNENEKFLTEPAFDYILNIMIDTPMKLSDILRNYIKEQDNDGRFN